MAHNHNRNHRYNYTKEGNTIICKSSFAKKEVRGIAKCAPTDTFDEEFGKKLAKLRCDYKIATKRYNYAVNKEFDARLKMENAELEHDKLMNYMVDAYEEKENLKKEFANIMKTLN